MRLAPSTAWTSVGLALAAGGALSLYGKPWRSRTALTLFVGGDESKEFHRQSEDLADGWE